MARPSSFTVLMISLVLLTIGVLALRTVVYFWVR